MKVETVMALHHLDPRFTTSHLDFCIANSDANAFCTNGHYYYPPHRHKEYFDWFYVADGEIYEIINGKKRTLKAGDLTWVRKNDRHEASGQGMKFFILCGASDWMESIMGVMKTVEAYHALLEAPEPPVCNVPANRRKAMLQQWEQAWKVHRGKLGPSHSIKLVADLFVDYFLPQVEHIMKRQHVPNWFHNAMNFIQNHVGEEISSEQLAELCGKSPEHVARSFQMHLGVTPSQYINSTRLNYAARLLNTTDLSITAVALRAGFGSMGYFHRLFRKWFNCSPRTYRTKTAKV